MRRYPTFSPTGAVCSKCNVLIENNRGRRFRLKWYHESCLPITRINKLGVRRSEVKNEEKHSDADEEKQN